MKRQKRKRRFQPVTVAAVYAALADGTLPGVAVFETIDAQHTPTTARFLGGGIKQQVGETTKIPNGYSLKGATND